MRKRRRRDQKESMEEKEEEEEEEMTSKRESKVFPGIYFCGIWLAFYASGFIVNDLN